MSDALVAPPASQWGCFAADVFDGSTVMITGAASGIGRATARAFLDLGATVALVDRDEPGLTALAAEAGPRAVALPCDLSCAESVERLFSRYDSRFPAPDALVSCAAIISAKRATQITSEDWQRVLSTNLVGTFAVLVGAIERMLPMRRGAIVAVGSDAGKRGGGGLVADAAYAASKAGVLSLVKSLAREYAGTGIRINALTPGPTDTPMHGALSEELKARIAAGLPVRRMGQPEDIAAAAVFLCSPAAEFVYAASLNVDGGSLFE